MIRWRTGLLDVRPETSGLFPQGSNTFAAPEGSLVERRHREDAISDSFIMSPPLRLILQ
jgi:hypothetical protein